MILLEVLMPYLGWVLFFLNLGLYFIHKHKEWFIEVLEDDEQFIGDFDDGQCIYESVEDLESE